VGEHAPIANPFKGLGSMVQPGPGHLVLLVGAPGVGKSAISLYWAAAAQPFVVVSLDTDIRTQFARLAAMYSGRSYEVLRKDPEMMRKALEEQEKHLPWFVDYDPGKDWGGLIAAARDFYGQTPGLLIDNLSNVSEHHDYEGYRNTVRKLIRLARDHDTCVFVCHHSRNPNDRGDNDPIRLRDVEYRVDKEPEFVLSVRRIYGEANTLPGATRLSVLKNRFGDASAYGDRCYVDIPFDYSTMRVA
jgi:hypothetical protein